MRAIKSEDMPAEEGGAQYCGQANNLILLLLVFLQLL